MESKKITNNAINIPSDWLTINEAIKTTRKKTGLKINESHIYRHALSHEIFLSIYFQSPVILRKVKTRNNKVTLKQSNNPSTKNITPFSNDSVFSKREIIVCTTGNFFTPTQKIIDTMLIGYEFVLIQHLLAQSLNISPPEFINEINLGISVSIDNNIFQAYKEIAHIENSEEKYMPSDITSNKIQEPPFIYSTKDILQKHFHPIYSLPTDACFVIRLRELDKFTNIISDQNKSASSSSRVSTPLSRMFWLACKHNEIISPLIKHPYKLLSIFEQWASDDGITDRLSGDTLKTALERGSPSSPPPSKK